MNHKDVCENCEFFVKDSKHDFGRCFANPPTPIVRRSANRGGGRGNYDRGNSRGKPDLPDSIKTTRPIVYSNDFCRFFQENGEAEDGGTSRRDQINEFDV